MSSYSHDKFQEKSSWDYPSASTNIAPSDRYMQFQDSLSSSRTSSSNQYGDFQGYGDINKSHSPQSPGTHQNTPQSGQQSSKLVSFDEFIKKKVPAFFFFSINPETKQQINQDDVDKVTNLSHRYDRELSIVYALTCIGTFGVDHYLRSKSLLYGMTYRTSLFRFFVKYWLLPGMASGLVDRVYAKHKYSQQIDSILNRYDFQQDPVFRRAFEKSMADPPKTSPFQRRELTNKDNQNVPNLNNIRPH